MLVAFGFFVHPGQLAEVVVHSTGVIVRGCERLNQPLGGNLMKMDAPSSQVSSLVLVQAQNRVNLAVHGRILFINTGFLGPRLSQKL
jgi:hypothetical protein